MAETGPEFPHTNIEIPSQGPSGSTAEIEQTQHRSLVAKVSGCIAVGLASLTAATAPAVAQEQAPLSDTGQVAAELQAGLACPWNYLGGDPAASCEKAEVPAACDPVYAPALQSQLRHNYLYVSPHRQMARTIVQNRARTSSTSEIEPRLSLGVADNGIRDNNRGQRQAQLWLSEQAGLDDLRVVIYPDMWDRFKHIYTEGIDAARACGKKVYATFPLARVNWTGERAYKFFKRAARALKGRVNEIGVGNEPNLSAPGHPEKSWLMPIGNHTLAETYRIIFTNAARGIREANPKSKVYIFETSSHAWPLRFMNQTLKCTSRVVKNCPPLRADGVAIHTYMDVTSRDVGKKGNKLPQFGKTVNWRSKSIGLDKLPTMIKGIQKFCKQGRLLMPRSKQCPPLAITEMAYEHRYKDGSELTDEAMSKLNVAGLTEVCRNNATKKNAITKYYHYHLQTTPLEVKMRGDKWDSAIVNDTSLNLNPSKVQSVPSMTYYTFEAFANSAIGKRCLSK